MFIIYIKKDLSHYVSHYCVCIEYLINKYLDIYITNYGNMWYNWDRYVKTGRLLILEDTLRGAILNSDTTNKKYIYVLYSMYSAGHVYTNG